LSLISGILFTANNFLINQWKVSVGDVVIVRTIIQMVTYTSICLYRDESLLPGSGKQKLLILIQGVMASLTFITSLACVSFMAVPDALCIIFACPVVTIALSAVLLRDSINIAKIIAGQLLLLGVILVCKPPFLFSIIKEEDLLTTRDDLYYVGVLLAVTACLAGGAMDVLVAKCSDLGQVSASVLCNWSAITGLVIAVIYGLLEEGSYILSPNIVNITWDMWATFIGLSVSGLFAFTTLTKSLQLISPNLVASLRCLELVLAFGVQSIITGENPDVISSVGGLLITLGVIVLAFQAKFLHYKDLLVSKIKMICQPKAHRRADEYERLINQTVVN